MNSLYQRFDYNYWAHKKVLGCVQHLSPEQFIAPIDYSVGSIRNQLVHTMSYEWVYLRRMQGHKFEPMPAYEDFPTSSSVENRWQIVEAAIREYVHHLTVDALKESIAYHSANGDLQHNTREELLNHVLNHSTDHRAQILARLHLMGVPTVAQDFIYYLRET